MDVVKSMFKMDSIKQSTKELKDLGGTNSLFEKLCVSRENG